jgi:transposase
MSTHVAALELSAAEIAELKVAYKQERDRRIAERIHCVILFAQGRGLRELKALLFVGVHTLATWIEAFRAHGLAGLRQWGYTGQEPDLTAEQWAEVEQELERKPYHRARDVAAFVTNRFQIAYSERGMQALLRRKGYRHIKARLVPGKAPDVEAQEAFVKGYQALKAGLGLRDRLYFVDATHPTHNVRISYVWAKKGVRRQIKSNSGRQRYNILGAYCPSDQEYIDIRGSENVNASTLQALIDQIRRRHPDAQRIILILDNARYNHARLVSEYITQTNVELHFLPAYAPNLNLIERLWRFVKDEVLNDAYYATFAEFTAAIEKVLDHLDQYADRIAKLMTEKFEILACV